MRMMRSVTPNHVTSQSDVIGPQLQLLPPVFSGGGEGTWEASVWDAPTLGEWVGVPEPNLPKTIRGYSVK